VSDSERTRALEAKRERALADLERTLIDEWDLASAVHPAPLPVPQVAPEAPARAVVSDQTKRTITIVALTIGGAIAAALKAMQ